jgi:hypothetical protein
VRRAAGLAHRGEELDRLRLFGLGQPGCLDEGEQVP